MKKILYIISTLKRSGPTNQLYYIIKYLDRSIFNPYIVTLSNESLDSRWKDFASLEVNLFSLKLSRVSGLLLAKSRIKEQINNINPDIIQTQGVRSDYILSKINTKIPWILTSRCYPLEDYIMIYTKTLGKLMALKHLSVMKKCKNVVSCSNAIAQKLSIHGIKSLAIQNGTEVLKKRVKESNNKYSPPIFLYVGHLIPRKNVSFIIKAFNIFSQLNPGSLIILGEGKESTYLKQLAINNNIYFEGRVNNVIDYLNISDYFISPSLSEGLPNAVLEALAAGLPVFLSDIPSHLEIKAECKNCCHIFKLSDGEYNLSQIFVTAKVIFSKSISEEATLSIKNMFSAKIMSEKYQKLYQSSIF
jgi:glycosyltransferase involved in cell wall biosynthesis